VLILSCKTCQGIIRKDWARFALFQICYLCCFFVIRVVLLLIVMFYLLFVCKCVLPPDVNRIAVDKYIDIKLLQPYRHSPRTFAVCTVIT
jgi:hypothetical protein